jgi:hypothetical protein
MGLFDAILLDKQPGEKPLFTSKAPECIAGIPNKKERKKREPKIPETLAAFDAVMQWATAAGIDRATVYAQFGGEKDLVKLKDKLSLLIRAKTNKETGEVTVSEQSEQRAVESTESSNSESLRDNDGVSGGQLVSRDTDKNKGTESRSVGQSIPSRDPEVEEMLNVIRRKLGIPISDVRPKIASRDGVESIMQTRMSLLQDLAYITNRFYGLRTTLENKIEALDKTWRPIIEDWYDENKPEGKKSIELMYGTVGRRNKALSIALDPQNQESFNNWIGAQPEEFKKQYNAQQISYWKWDWEVYKKTLDETSKVPGTIVTPAQKDVFFVGPSIDTVIDKAKKGKEI